MGFGQHGYGVTGLILILVLIFPGSGVAQQVPVLSDHPVNPFLEREITLGRLPDLDSGIRPFTREQIEHALLVLDQRLPAGAPERRLLARFQAEFDIIRLPLGLALPLDRPQRHRLEQAFRDRDLTGEFPHLLVYRKGAVSLWGDWLESGRIETDGTHSRRFSQDQVTLQGFLGEHLSFLTRYTQHRLTHTPGFTPEFPPEYKQGFILIHQETQWRIWDQNLASLRYSGKYLDMELGKRPLTWGYGGSNSPILSSNAPWFPALILSARLGRLQVETFTGQLLPAFDPEREVDLPEKNLAGHRIEVGLGNDLRIAFSELVVYGNRGLQLGYMIPITPFVTEEHQQGDRDNDLLALEFKWRLKPGVEWFGTFFVDDISWFQMFDPWWGSKFLIQTGLYYVPSNNPAVPDLSLVLTAARPWVYTHGDSINRYSNAEQILGFPLGPNSRQIQARTTLQPTHRLGISADWAWNWKGSGMGSELTDDYDYRDQSLDSHTTWLMGQVKEYASWDVSAAYRFSRVLNLRSTLRHSTEPDQTWMFLGLEFDW